MSSAHILIVDDEPKVAFFLGKALERSNQNYQVTTVHSGEKALEVLNRSPVDLVVTDLRMPGISGLDLIKWIRSASPSTRAILITAYGNSEIEAKARRLQAYRYITKPFQVTDFAQVVHEALSEVAVSRPGIVVFSGESFEAISAQLDSLRVDIGARCIFLADMQGQRLTEVGDTRNLDSSTLLALLAGGFATSNELARRFGNGEAANLNFHEGSKHDIYSANVSDNLFLAIIYDRQVQASRIGVVWLYTRRTINSLLSIISTAETAAPDQSLDANFGSSLMAELDSVFDGDATPRPERPSQAEADHGRPLGGDSNREPKPGFLRPSQEAEQEQGEQELFDLKTAIERGLVPPNLDID